jgi:hypothetical protein
MTPFLVAKQAFILTMHIMQFINKHHHLHHVYTLILESMAMEAIRRGDYDDAPRTHNDGDINDDIRTSSTRTHGGDFWTLFCFFLIYLWSCISFLL